MLTDIFAHRYADVELSEAFSEADRRLIVQAFRLLSEQVCPYFVNGHETERGKAFWADIQSRLAMELGLQSLSATAYSYQTMWNGKPHTITGTWTMDKVCENWMYKPFDGAMSVDKCVKERLSLVELGFRKREQEIADENARLPAAIQSAKEVALRRGGIRLPGDPAEGVRAANQRLNDEFKARVHELNERFRQAGYELHYHNGFIQLSTDMLSRQQIEEPFWGLVADAKWQNVDTDMKQALDLRDTGGRDPAFYAARALESTIKIISDEKGVTTGKEKGAHNYIENLASKKVAFIADWEASALKDYFTKVRNPFGHGPGNAPMPALSAQQTDWAIEACMVWIKSLVRRV